MLCSYPRLRFAEAVSVHSGENQREEGELCSEKRLSASPERLSATSVVSPSNSTLPKGPHRAVGPWPSRVHTDNAHGVEKTSTLGVLITTPQSAHLSKRLRLLCRWALRRFC